MSRDFDLKIGSTIYGKIQAARMSERERQIALNAMRNATTLVDGMAWLSNKIQQAAGRLFLKPGLKP